MNISKSVNKAPKDSSLVFVIIILTLLYLIVLSCAFLFYMPLFYIMMVILGLEMLIVTVIAIKAWGIWIILAPIGWIGRKLNDMCDWCNGR